MRAEVDFAVTFCRVALIMHAVCCIVEGSAEKIAPSKQVFLDGRNIRGLPLTWLRRQIGLVSQASCTTGIQRIKNRGFCS